MLNNNKNEDWYSAHEKRYKELNNELVIPDYKEFCLDKKIQIPSMGDALQSTYSGLKKHNELLENSLNLYNKIKRKYHFFKSRIVMFHFSTASDFTYEEFSVEEFINITEGLINSFRVRNIILTIYGCLFVFLLLMVSLLCPGWMSTKTTIKYIFASIIFVSIGYFFYRNFSDMVITLINRKLRRDLRKLQSDIEKFEEELTRPKF